MRNALLCVVLTVFAGCGPTSPTPRGADLAVAESNSDRSGATGEASGDIASLRAQVSELESRLQSTTAERDDLGARAAELEETARRLMADADDDANAAQAQAAANQRDRLQADTTYSVPENGGVLDGPRHALVTIVVATEAACPYCWKAEDMLDELRKAYKKDIRIIYQSRIVHRTLATEPALAFCAADRQRKGMKMLKAIRERYEVYRTKGDQDAFARANLIAAAKKLGLKLSRFERDMDGDCKAVVAAQDEFLAQMGVNGTPTFFINGKVVEGARESAVFTALIDAELAAARALIAAGVDKKSLYPAIVAFGKKTI